MFSLKNRVCLITGGATGIGYQVARAFAEAGGSIALAYNSSEGPAQEGVEALRRDFGVRAEAFKIPATDPHAVEAGVKKVEETFGRLDVVRPTILVCSPPDSDGRAAARSSRTPERPARSTSLEPPSTTGRR
jgi:NAD(P)-dependent dehydrogenase (short-subunit alcohol dehydrogenase family)